MRKSELNIEDIINEYNECKSIHKVASKYNTSHIRVSKLLKENNVEINNIGKKKEFSESDINNMIEDYIVNHMTMENISKNYGIRIKRLRQIFRDNNIKISKWNGHMKKGKKQKTLKKNNEEQYKYCPYCDWKTKDLLNKSHSYQKHLINIHKIDINKHLALYPEDITFLQSLVLKEDLIKCEICGKLLHVIDKRHLDQHNITKQEYIEKYGNANLITKKTKEKLQSCLQKMNNNKTWDRKSSSYEKDIKYFLQTNNICFEEHNRKILNGLEIDLISNNIGIEFNGNKFHTEWFGGKTKFYHLNKTLKCNEQGIKLMQIFEDEYVEHKNIVLNKVSHILGIQNNLPKIMGRKCKVEIISKDIAEQFLNDYHVQGYARSTVYLGALYENNLIAVMTFKQEFKNSSKWELTRFASDYHFICQGVGGKIFNWFIKNYNPSEIKSFADRRWTLDKENNLYVKLGFKLTEELKPEYRYYNPKVSKIKRFHKFGFRKQLLNKKYGLPLTMTETEMVRELGYDRIWDCGLFKFVWKKEKD